MAGKDIIMASKRELRRLHIIEKVLEGALRQVEAARIISLSDRQIRRIIKRVRVEGEGGIVHRSRGRFSNRSVPKKIKAKVIALYREKYKGFGPTFASEKLNETEGIKISDETLRKWLIESGDWKKDRKVRTHRQRRERKERSGEMVQIDGSHHDWFEGRGPECVFMGYIDDATGRVIGRFYEYEGTIPAMDSFKRYIRRYGIPLSVYLDRHTTYKSPVEPLFEGEPEALSQFQRAMAELGVKVIHANSPQAKGRVERLFRTLQDRLVKEMRLQGIRNIEEANEFLKRYLPLHNRRFAVKATKKGNLHMEIPKGLNINNILCIKEERTVKNDLTIAYNRKLYQITDKTRASKVTVVKRTNGSMAIVDRETGLKFKEIIQRPLRQPAQVKTKQPKRVYRPAADHPWRKSSLKRKHLNDDKKENDKQEI